MQKGADIIPKQETIHTIYERSHPRHAPFLNQMWVMNV